METATAYDSDTMLEVVRGCGPTKAEGCVAVPLWGVN
jgi:hypothetical protein